MNTATDTVTPSLAASSNDGGALDGAISADGSTVDINGFLTDPLVNLETVSAYIDWETWLPAATYGQKLSSDGSILYQPLTDGVDLLERNTGRLLYRIQVPANVAEVYDSMLPGQGPGTLGFLTAAGVTFIDLSSLSLPSGASTLFPAARSVSDASAVAKLSSGLQSVPRAKGARPALSKTGAVHSRLRP